MSGALAVAMSGGLDSSVTAWLLSRRQGTVFGLSMLLWREAETRQAGRCCGALDLGDARRVARQCGIPHYTLPMEVAFRRQVVEPFVQEYLQGRTPLPCTRCNTWIKFDLLLERARAMGAEALATGHYARIVEGPDGPELHRAVDETKDQTYYLFELDRRRLAALRFPLGEMRKSAVRELARQAGLRVAEKGESMDLCFVAEGVREFVEAEAAERPERYGDRAAPEPARVVDGCGRELGQGAPFFRYTVGQRRGLGVAGGERLYVLGIDPRRNEVRVGPRRELLEHGLVGRGLHWIGPPLAGRQEVTVRIRSRHPGVPAEVWPSGDGGARVEFAEPQAGVAPGQAAVFYRGSRVLGGCWIEAPLSSSSRATRRAGRAPA